MGHMELLASWSPQKLMHCRNLWHSAHARCTFCAGSPGQYRNDEIGAFLALRHWLLAFHFHLLPAQRRWSEPIVKLKLVGSTNITAFP